MLLNDTDLFNYDFLCNTSFVSSIILSTSLSIVGLTNQTLGRSCTHHDCCGKLVEIGNILHVHRVSSIKWGQVIDSLEVYLVVDGIDTCKCRYLGKEHAGDANVLDDKYVRVVDVYDEGDSDINRRR